MRTKRTQAPWSGRAVLIVGMASVVLAGGGDGQADEPFAFLDTDCHALKLKRARGVPDGVVRAYDFVGTCNLVRVLPSGPSVLRTFPARAQVTWNASKRELTEAFATIGTFEWDNHTRGGSVHSIYKCNEDPIVVKKGVACAGVAHKNETGIEPLSNPFTKLFRPITRGKTTLAEATALSGGS